MHPAIQKFAATFGMDAAVEHFAADPEMQVGTDAGVAAYTKQHPAPTAADHQAWIDQNNKNQERYKKNAAANEAARLAKESAALKPKPQPATDQQPTGADQVPQQIGMSTVWPGRRPQSARREPTPSQSKPASQATPQPEPPPLPTRATGQQPPQVKAPPLHRSESMRDVPIVDRPPGFAAFDSMLNAIGAHDGSVEQLQELARGLGVSEPYAQTIRNIRQLSDTIYRFSNLGDRDDVDPVENPGTKLRMLLGRVGIDHRNVKHHVYGVDSAGKPGIEMPSKVVDNEDADAGDQLGLFGEGEKQAKRRPKWKQESAKGKAQTKNLLGMDGLDASPGQQDLFGVSFADAVARYDAKAGRGQFIAVDPDGDGKKQVIHVGNSGSVNRGKGKWKNFDASKIKIASKRKKQDKVSPGQLGTTPDSFTGKYARKPEKQRKIGFADAVKKATQESSDEKKPKKGTSYQDYAKATKLTKAKAKKAKRGGTRRPPERKSLETAITDMGYRSEPDIQAAFKQVLPEALQLVNEERSEVIDALGELLGDNKTASKYLRLAKKARDIEGLGVGYDEIVGRFRDDPRLAVAAGYTLKGGNADENDLLAALKSFDGKLPRLPKRLDEDVMAKADELINRYRLLDDDEPEPEVGDFDDDGWESEFDNAEPQDMDDEDDFSDVTDDDLAAVPFGALTFQAAVEYYAAKLKDSPGQMGLFEDSITGNMRRSSKRQKKISWDESKHPRKSKGAEGGGRFTKAGDTGEAKPKVKDPDDISEEEKQRRRDFWNKLAQEQEAKKKNEDKPEPEPQPEPEPEPKSTSEIEMLNEWSDGGWSEGAGMLTHEDGIIIDKQIVSGKYFVVGAGMNDERFESRQDAVNALLKTSWPPSEAEQENDATGDDSQPEASDEREPEPEPSPELKKRQAENNKKTPEPDKPKKDGTPRQQAAARQAELDADYKFARKSSMPNRGEDLKGSARHKRNEWRSLEEAEKEGTAEELVTRNKLLRNEPHELSIHVDDNPAEVIAMNEAMRTFPAKPGYGANSKRGSQERKAKEREHYLESYRQIKQAAEQIAAKGTSSNPLTALESLADTVRKRIHELRRQSNGIYVDGDDALALQSSANGLVDFYNKLYFHHRRRTSLAKKVGQYMLAVDRHNDESKTGLNKKQALAQAAIPALEGKTLSSLQNSLEGKGKSKSIRPADYYTGKIQRKGGRDLGFDGDGSKAAEFVEKTAKFRGLQFGNSMPDKERVHHAIETANAIADLADVIGVPVEQISLDGVLGLAQGARGRMGAAAHYEPASKVINLTRANGSGSFAHEWGHAMDHFIGGSDLMRTGRGKLAATYLSDNTASETRTGKMVDGKWTSSKIDNTSNPLWVAMDNVRKTWQSSGFNDRLNKNIQELESQGLIGGKGNQHGGSYWGSNREKLARTFERYVQHKLSKDGRENSYLSGTKDTMLWPNADEMNEMAPAFDALMTAFRKEATGSEKPHKYTAAERAAIIDQMVAMSFADAVSQYSMN